MAQHASVTINRGFYLKSPEEKTAYANEIAKGFGISDADLDAVERYKDALSDHDAWNLPIMGYVNEEGFGYAYAPTEAVAADGWDAHKAFLDMPEGAQTAFAIRMLCTHRDVSRAGARMFLRYHRGIVVLRQEEDGTPMESSVE
ncbi:hypothetical protein [Bifidobacterium psychraerophilum]|uniref:Pyruvate dehydrogenase beta subunit n=1 Tax=Bifidobacterium psychraerophilum TaxID=218140 RepID=A0A087CDI5_9BIFI|nr:hypothetical protein [Bifidobacterium psychraerophilum]KFI81335.1 pyruvate dehydrogenase beta subunit [Bifidobacterium psychraerophilum]PKA95678.1 hypothetical protein A9A89_1955 [Bifidobacterium psychraerophilum DSM 22366]